MPTNSLRHASYAAYFLATTVPVFTLAAAADPFAGTWRFRMNRSQMQSTYKFLAVGEGKFQTDNGVALGPVLPVDGSFHESPLGGMVSLKQIDDRTYVYTVKRQTLYNRTITLGGDKMKWAEDQELDTGKHDTWKSEWARVGHGNGLAGEWRMTSQTDPDEDKESFSNRVIPNGLRFKDSESRHEDDIHFDGKEHADTSLNGTKGVSYTAERLDAHSYRQVMRRNGQVIDTFTCKLSDDENTLTCTRVDNQGKTNVGVSERVSQ